MEGLPVHPRAPTAVIVIDCSKSGGDSWLHLLPVANRPLVLRILDSLIEAGVGGVALAAEPELVLRLRGVLDAGGPWPFEPRHVRCRPSDGLPGTLRAAAGLCPDNPLLLHWGCGVFSSSLGRRLGSLRPGRNDAFLLVEESRSGSPVVDLAAERLAALSGGSQSRSRASLAGVALLGAGVCDAARAVEPGGGAELDLLSVVERMARLGGRVRSVPAGRCWRFSGAADSALGVNRFLLEEIEAEAIGPETLETTVEGPAHIDPTATLERSIIRGPVVVGPRTSLLDAYVGPYTSIGQDVCVEGAEVENSIVLDGSRIRHLGGRLEASVVGPEASIGRDLRLPRALRLHVGEGARVSLG